MIEKMRMMANAMDARIARQEIIANNLANANSAGFKKDRIFQDIIDKAGTKNTFTKTTDFSQGSLRETGSQLDLALQGKGFLTISTPTGEKYSRGGHLRINNYGELVIENGLHVMGQNGIISGQGEMAINKKGEVFFDGELSDKLNIVYFPDEKLMQKSGDSLFNQPVAGLNSIVADQVIVHQGFLEESNVQPIQEMVNMLTAFRHFEADQKVITVEDGLLRRVANDVGKV